MLFDTCLDAAYAHQRPHVSNQKIVAFLYVAQHDQVYDVQQVYDHMWLGLHEGEEKVINTKDFPAVAPPADAAWFEFTARWGRRMAGLLLVDYDLLDDDDWALCREQNPEWAAFGDKERERQRWLLRVIGIVNAEPYNAVAVLNHQAYGYVGYDGSLVGFAVRALDPDHEGDVGNHTIHHIADTVLTSLCFMNARGTLLDRSCQQPRAERRRREKARLRPAVTFNIVNIKPLLTRYARPQDAPRGTQPFHWVRGNFARYTEDAPLFGKYVGTVYRPLHAAGKKSEGQVVKTYTVEIP